MATGPASNVDLGGAKRVQQHWPGPPPKVVQVAVNSAKTSDEIQQLKMELQSCRGKLKGYEILGHLFQESKQECARYKMQNEELVKKIDSLAASSLSETPVLTESYWGVRSSSTAANNPSAGPPLNVASQGSGASALPPLPVGSSAQASSSSSHVLLNSGVGRGRPSDLDARPHQHQPFELGKGVNLVEMGAATTPAPAAALHGPKSGGSSSGGSSPSFVQISESDVVSPASGSLRNQLFDHSSVTSTEGVPETPAADVSVEINQLTDQIKKLGQSGSNTSVQDLSADLIRAGVSVLKLQKQNRVQQVLMEKMNAEVVQLRANIAEKEVLIQRLQLDCRSLGDKVKQMEAARSRALQEAQTRILETAADPDDNLAGPNSTEWVEVEKHQSSGTTAAAAAAQSVEPTGGNDEAVVTATSMVEMELRRRVEKLSATITELVTVNRNWDEHCREMEASHKQQVAAMQNNLAEMQARMEEYERSDEKRQLEFDSILLNSKQQREAEETAKEEALDQLHRERQLRTEAEFKCLEFSRKTVELETQLTELKNSSKVRSTNYAAEPPQHHEQPMSARERELCSQLVILQEQINVFKEDFDQERSDREAARGKTEKLRRQLSETQNQVAVLQSQLARANADLKATKTENEQWRLRFQKLTGDVEALRRQTQQVPQTPAVQRVIRQPVQQPPQLHAIHEFHAQRSAYHQQAEIRRPSWSCLLCTFRNSGTSGSCAMCGTPKSRDLYQTDIPVGGRPVAGLQDYSPYQPYSALVSRSLESDVVDNNQQQQQQL